MFLHLSLNSFQHSSRILKECNALSKLGWDKQVMVAALWEPDLEYEEITDSGVIGWRIALKTRAWPKNLLVQLIKYIEWMCTVIVRMRSEDLTVIHAHNIGTLPTGIVLKWLTGAPVIYDAHELESETNGLSELRRKLSRWMEGLWIRGVDGTLTVCDSIADWYEAAYSIDRPTVVRNIPVRSDLLPKKSTVLRDNHSIPKDALIFLYQGGLSPGRSIERLIEIFADLDAKRHLVIMGYGVLQDYVIEAADKYANIHFQPAVPPSRVLFYTSSADIGLCLIENPCLSYYYSLPNKLFEYLLCDLPVLVNDLPEQRSIIERFECGWLVPTSLEQQKALVSSIDIKVIAAKKIGAGQAAESFDWENEATRLRHLYLEVANDDVHHCNAN